MSTSRFLCVGVAITLGLMLAGCSSTGVITAANVRANVSPELETIDMSSQQRANRWAKISDYRWRLLNADLDKILMMDKVPRMHPTMIP